MGAPVHVVPNFFDLKRVLTDDISVRHLVYKANMGLDVFRVCIVAYHSLPEPDYPFIGKNL